MIQVADFSVAYSFFKERVTINQCSQSMISNYSRSIAIIALHFKRLPHLISVAEINSYLYELMLQENFSPSYFKHAIYALRYWFRLYNMESKALSMPRIKQQESLPVVLSRRECRELFRAPVSLKHRYILAFAYSGGLRMNELRLLKISDVDTDRKLIHVRAGKGRKDRYVVLSNLLIQKLTKYLHEVKPQLYLFEGKTPGQPFAEHSLRHVISAALKRTCIKKKVSMHTLRHSFATHLLEDGVDVHSIQRQLGHSNILTTVIYLHVAQVSSRRVHSPLDSLYNLEL
jgi:integrase/recombinase XerD